MTNRDHSPSIARNDGGDAKLRTEGSGLERTISGETLYGIEVAGYRSRYPIPAALQGPEWTYVYASHWSTPAARENAERLYAEPDVLRLIQTQRELVAAARVVMAGLLERIDAAPKTAVPVFAGIAELHAALAKAEGR